MDNQSMERSIPLFPSTENQAALKRYCVMLRGSSATKYNKHHKRRFSHSRQLQLHLLLLLLLHACWHLHENH